MAYNVLQKLNDNIGAIRIALAHQKGDPLTAEDTASLKKYSGFGGIKAILYPNGSQEEWIANGATKDDLKLHKDIMQLHELLRENYPGNQYKEIIGSLRNSVLTAFYTPKIVPQTLYEIFNEQGIKPKRFYEPSAGSGVFINEAAKAFPELEHTAVEKDRLSGLVLSALNSTLSVKTDTHITGFEEAPLTDNGSYDLIVSNIPFGNFSVYDEAYPNRELSGKIHNYFFAKGLDKLAEGGLMAYIATDAFLNSPSNKTAREYLFDKADFISLAVMPDNLMKDTGNTGGPNHLLIVQKNTGKQYLSDEEEALVAIVQMENIYGSYAINQYVHDNPGIIAGNEIRPGKNQYGNAHETIWQQGNITGIADKLKEVLNEDFGNRFNHALYQEAKAVQIAETKTKEKLTYLPMPENRSESVPVQLGLFDTAPAENINRAMVYINPMDQTVVQKNTARIISLVRTTDNPAHENIVLLTAKQHKSGRYLYKLYSNVKEINHLPVNWMNAGLLTYELTGISNQLKVT